MVALETRVSQSKSFVNPRVSFNIDPHQISLPPWNSHHLSGLVGREMLPTALAFFVKRVSLSLNNWNKWSVYCLPGFCVLVFTGVWTVVAFVESPPEDR